jgi:signal transduction histidine kinase
MLPARGESGESNIQLELARRIYVSPFPSIACLVMVLGTCVLLWPDLPSTMILAWGAITGSAHLVRLGMQYSHPRNLTDGLTAARWLYLHAWNAAWIGTAWSLLAVPIAMRLSGTPLVAVITVIVGMIAGATINNHPHMPSVVTIIWPIAIATSIALASRGDAPDLVFAALFLFMAGTAHVFATQLHQSLRETLQSRFDRTKLASDLSDRNLQLARANADLHSAQMLAEGANRAKSEFLSNMSHELRTPLNAIIGFSEIIKDQAFGPEAQSRYREYAQDIYESGRHLLQLINDVLDLSKVEAGKMELRRKVIDLPDLMSRCMRLIKTRAAKAHIRLETSFNPSASSLLADEGRVRQILLNLLANAVKFTPAGGTVTVSTDIDEHGAIAISVEDTGVGMDASEIQVALERFGQASSSLTRSYEGTGLGLPLTKALVDLHGGQLTIVSEKGKGTTVTVIFPPQVFPKGEVEVAK